jgi:hypothetical protein
MKIRAVVAALILAGTSTGAMAASLDARVRTLEDRTQIENLLMEYGRSLDARDFATYSHLFATNGEWSGSIGTFKGPAGIQAAMEKAFQVPATAAATGAPAPNFHLLTNPIIDVQGDKATALSKWTFVRVVDNKPVIALSGTYEDTFTREQGQWKFLKRLASAPVAPASSPSLTTQDYIDIQQLSARYAFAIDVCSNAGHDYSDLYTPDGEFAVSDQWGGGGKRTFVTTGRDALAKVAGGRGDHCVDPASSPGLGLSHLTENLIITPTATGASGRSYLLAIGVGKDPTRIERQGGYEDVYVKTADGWRIKTRTHVWPNMADSAMFKQFGKVLTAPSSAGASAK